VDAIYLKVADSFGIRQPQMLFKIILPAAFPLIANGLHLAWDQPGVPGGWRNVGAQSGLGYLIIDARNSLRSDLVLAGIIFIGALGLLLDRLIKLVETGIEKQWGISEGGEADMYISIEGVSREYFFKGKGRYPLRM